TDTDAETFYAKEWRWLETNDRNFAHMTPIQGDWTISGIGLPPEVLRKIYFDNARKLLARSIPVPSIKAAHVKEDFNMAKGFNHKAWKTAPSAHLDYNSSTYATMPPFGTTTQILWS